MKKTLFILIVLSVLILPTVAFGISPGGTAGAISGAIEAVAGVCVVLGFAISAILFLTSAGDPQRVTQAKQAFFWSAVGTIVYVGGKEIVEGLIK